MIIVQVMFKTVYKFFCFFGYNEILLTDLLKFIRNNYHFNESTIFNLIIFKFHSLCRLRLIYTILFAKTNCN